MIDIEADIFDYVYPIVAPLVPEGCFKSVYVPAPPALPLPPRTVKGAAPRTVTLA